MKIEVTSASRKEEPLNRVPAAIFVLTRDDLRRSGATSIPEALRLVPGMDVARLDSNRWAVSARGFMGQFANKMLVLIDGRSVYTPLFSGVWWDEVDVPFDDIERIEVIRGPGAAMWGSNAVNGVINIITRDSSNTQGALVSAAGGNQDRAMSYARYGGALDDGTWRLWGKYFDRASTDVVTGASAEDDWQMGSGGFRADLLLDAADKLLIEADAHNGEVHNRLFVPSRSAPFQTVTRNLSEISGWSVLSRWTRKTGATSELQLQSYVDGTSRDAGIIVEDRTNESIDLQHRFMPFENNEMIWGLSYRSTRADTQGSFVLSLGDNHRTDNLFGAFVQDEVDLVPDRWKFTLGSKLENNDYTGWELQPNVRLTFTPDDKQTVWASVSRAVRTPSQVEDDVRLVQTFTPGAPNQVVTLFGNHDLEAEQLTAYELGYRVQPTERLSFDLATFYNEYANLITFEAGTPFLSGGDLIIPLVAQNSTQGHAYGAELAADWAVLSDTRLRLGYSFIDLTVDNTPTAPSVEGSSVPRDQVQMRVQHDLNQNTELDFTLMYVDSMKNGNIEDYIRADTRVEWRPSTHMGLTLGVQNIFHDGQVESHTEQFELSSKSRTAFYLKATWSY